MTQPGYPDEYADIIDNSGLRVAIRDALIEIGSPLALPPAPKDSNSAVYSCLTKGVRKASVHVAAEIRSFILELTEHGIIMANGDSPDILLTARIIHHWLEDMCTLDVLEKYPFITLDDFARAYERGEEVEAKWDYYLSTIGDNHPELLDFVKEAYEYPELRQLFPFISLNVFCLSQCTGYPYKSSVPHVVPVEKNRYRVQFSKKRFSSELVGDVSDEMTRASAPLRLNVDSTRMFSLKEKHDAHSQYYPVFPLASSERLFSSRGF